MRKIKLQMQLSLDGFVVGENGEMDWLIWDWDDALKEYVKEITTPVDTIILGRVLAQGFIPTWAERAADVATADIFTHQMNDTTKVVFTKTLESSVWENTHLAKGDLTEEINALKNKTGKDIIVYGGGNFVSNLIANNLIDEYHFFINPVILGKGLAIFQGLADKLALKTVKSQTFECGIVVLCYEQKK